jgi:hypothetical protein
MPPESTVMVMSRVFEDKFPFGWPQGAAHRGEYRQAAGAIAKGIDARQETADVSRPFGVAVLANRRHSPQQEPVVIVSNLCMTVTPISQSPWVDLAATGNAICDWRHLSRRKPFMILTSRDDSQRRHKHTRDQNANEDVIGSMHSAPHERIVTERNHSPRWIIPRDHRTENLQN